MKEIVQRFICFHTYERSPLIEHSYEHWEDTSWSPSEINRVRALYPKERYRIVTVKS